MNKEEEILKLTADIAALNAKEQESRSIRHELREAQNHLAYLTAYVYVVVGNGKSVTVYGVALEMKTRADRLFMSIDADNAVSVTCHHSGGKITLSLPADGYIRFTLTDLDDEAGRTTYTLRAFVKEEEAWACALRMNNSPR